MVRVKNRKAVFKISKNHLRANRARNLVAVCAILLTTMLFMALFTIAGTMVYSFQQATFRQVGGNMHGTFKNLTLEQKRELEKDPLIKKAGSRLLLGVASGDAFVKTHAELSFMDRICQEAYFCAPSHGRAPKEGEKEIACDTRALSCLGVEPKIGEPVTVTYEVGGGKKEEITDTFYLSGWWEYDYASSASMLLLPKSYVDETVAKHPRDEQDIGDYTGTWDLTVNFKSSMHIGEDMIKTLENHGFQAEDQTAENYISIGVNWGYAGAQLAANADPEMVVCVLVALVLICFSGYLIIHNVFYISVNGDIRFYGLLKTIGTTGAQIRRIVRTQALLLSAAGIPFGIVSGFLAGQALAPVLLSSMSGQKTYRIVQPWFFIVSAAFSLFTTFLSCAKPGRIAAKASPIEAVRYIEAGVGGKKKKRGRSGARAFSMARANLARSKKKTVLAVASMALVIVLLEFTYTFTTGFDMDQYLDKWVVSDFILSEAPYFQVGTTQGQKTLSLPEEDIENLKKGGEITKGGRIYGHVNNMQGSMVALEYVPEEVYRQFYGAWLPKEDLDEMVELSERNEDGLLSMNAHLYGMEDYPLSRLNVVEGDLSDVYDPDKRAIAAVYGVDDYGKVMPDTQWAKVGDKVKVRYVREWEFVDDKTGEVIPAEKLESYGSPFSAKEKDYQDVTYEVVACVTMKNAMSYRYYESYEFVLNDKVFTQDSGTKDVMSYLFDVAPESMDQMLDFLADYTENENPALDFESKQTYVQEFHEYRNMFLLTGGALCFVVGLVGVLNFFNTVFASIFSRRREFATLQSIGMSGRQLKRMLVCEGLLYVGMTALSALLLCVLTAPLARTAGSGLAWYFHYHFTLVPVFAVLPAFVALGVAVPLLCYRSAAKRTIVERLSQGD